MKRIPAFTLIACIIIPSYVLAQSGNSGITSSPLDKALCTNEIQELRRMMRHPEEIPEIETETDTMFVPPRHVEINVNQAGLELEYGENRSVGYPIVMNYGAGLQINGDFIIGSLNMAMGNEMTKYLTVDMGLKGLLGQVESGDNDGDMASIGLYTSGAYDNRSSTGIPFEITAMICMAPNILSFIDAEEYLSFKTSLGIHIFPNKRGTLFAGLRYTEIQLDGGEDISEARPFIGFRFRY